ncbi:MAG: twin-arginine translocase TatA/TatE family subunit [Polyangiaceae bacterium]|nr:twin-arginine translocase TatA/TatE family subunit [Polyangiaceae bacterium]
MGNLGAFEIILIVAVVLLLFGAGRIAEIGKGLGEGIRNFKRGMREGDAPPGKQTPGKAAAKDPE